MWYLQKPMSQLVSPRDTGEEESLLSIASQESLRYLEKHHVQSILVKCRLVYLEPVYSSISLSRFLGVFLK